MSSYETTKSPFVSTKKKKQLKVVQAIHFVNCGGAGSSGRLQIRGEIRKKKSSFFFKLNSRTLCLAPLQIYPSSVFLRMSSNRTSHNKRQCSAHCHHRVSICYLTACKQQSCVQVCSFSFCLFKASPAGSSPPNSCSRQKP